MGETLFSMIYEVEVVLPVKIGVETTRVLEYTPKGSVATQIEELDLVKKKWIQAFYRMEQYRA